MFAFSTPSAEKEKFARRSNHDVWFGDSVCSRHITYRRDWFSNISEASESIVLGDDGPCEIKGCGVVPVKRLVNGVWMDINLENVLFVPGFKQNLTSLGVCTGRGIISC